MNRPVVDRPVPTSWRKVLLLAVAATAFGTAMAQDTAARADVPTLKVGDRWKYERNDRRTGAKEAEFTRTIATVTAARIEGTDNDAKLVLNPDLSAVENGSGTYSGDSRYVSFPMEVGKKWSFKYNFVNKTNAGQSRWQLDATVVGYEKVKVPAGEFDAFKIEYKGYWNNDRINRNGRITQTSWFAPAARATVKTEYDDTYSNWVQQLVEMQLQP
jgi:hypothetical protein